MPIVVAGVPMNGYMITKSVLKIIEHGCKQPHRPLQRRSREHARRRAFGILQKEQEAFEVAAQGLDALLAEALSPVEPAPLVAPSHPAPTLPQVAHGAAQWAQGPTLGPPACCAVAADFLRSFLNPGGVAARTNAQRRPFFT